MADYRKTFPKPNTLLMVVHAVNPAQVHDNVNIAYNEGADGVFLINHRIPAQALKDIYEEARNLYPTWWVGLNFLDLLTQEALAFAPPCASGLWADNAGVHESGDDPCADAKAISAVREQFPGLYFGGIAFKYQAPVQNAAEVARLAVPYVDVLTTSGEATGHAPSVEKIQTMRNAVGSHPLAIASGITPENVERYCAYADCFLVATGVSYSHTQLNPQRVRKLVRVLSSMHR